MSVRDTFTDDTGRVIGENNGDIACDRYRRYFEDIALIADVGVSAYRFRIAGRVSSPTAPARPRRARSAGPASLTWRGCSGANLVAGPPGAGRTLTS
ncbi:family 1 glycosylhydrolase [Micromonospora sp. NPDC049679]|uniref:family 1 glycosylhydrolase n=1 Tax=Micromonospora sp. NPDC049679 TaxID=3155920 RepID=UPI003409F076